MFRTYNLATEPSYLLYSPLLDWLCKIFDIESSPSSCKVIGSSLFSSLCWFSARSICRWAWSSISTWINDTKQTAMERNVDKNTTELYTGRVFDISILKASFRLWSQVNGGMCGRVMLTDFKFLLTFLPYFTGCFPNLIWEGLNVFSRVSRYPTFLSAFHKLFPKPLYEKA